jgi:DNA-directed RNA polymerase subunit K/omega
VLVLVLEMSDGSELQNENGPAIPTEPVAPITSRFLFVDVAALRAKQLRRGARLRIQNAEEHLPKKAERLAMEEVKRGLVAYDVPARKVQGADGGEDEA